jgi:hypothetical protein
MQPREQAFDSPSTVVAPQNAAILGQSSGARETVRCDHLDAVVHHQALVHAVAVIGPVADQPLRQVGKESFLDSGLDEFGFMRRSAGHVHGERKTMADLQSALGKGPVQ